VTRPLLIVLAGPNGSGKTTLCGFPTFKQLLESRTVRVINPDVLALQAPTGGNALIWSGRQVHKITAEFIATRQSFLVETTLSGRNHFKTVELAKSAGFETALHFVFVSDVELAKKRVQLRVSLGGHDVPEVDQERRYGKSLAHAAEMITVVHEAFDYRNDFRTKNHELIAEYKEGKRNFAVDQLPAWLP
jgi:predicted ABC-type ATPase